MKSTKNLLQPVGIAGGLESVALVARCNLHVLRHGVLDDIGLESHLLVGAGNLLEGEVHEAILVARAHVEEVVAVHLDVLHRDVVALAQRHVLAIAEVEELSPWTNHEKTAYITLDVIHRYILIMLRSVWAHLQPEHTLCVAHLDVAKDDVAVVHALAAQG